MSKKWPADFPANCPPKTASHSKDKFYRLVDNFPPDSNDFLRTRDNPTQKDKDFHGAGIINSYGTSFFSKIGDALSTKRKFKKAMASKKIASGVIGDDVGVVMQTYKPSHHTAWFYTDAVPENCFKTEEKEES
ncbi:MULTISPECIES: hypothetical protein [Aeromonas]|uniref:hypothetical protein n=1 Tax=Aeromonas TaxID=642 RepID=UPI00191EC748|nr:hypothetical protein [Aeromonas caviae]MBL0605799.1 hypothetical protein [Aeromonas caviae]MDX7713070.1 hypothetical protein [Aeromonas caviae]